MVARTAGRQSWLALAALTTWAALNPLGCGGGGPDGTSPILEAESVEGLLVDVGPMVVVPTLEDFEEQATLLVEALAIWAEDLGAGVDPTESHQAAEAAFIEAMWAWQQAEVHQLGPAASSLTALGGQDLRDELYSWPTVNTCRVDQETVEGDWDAVDFFEVNLVNSYGLDAIEHILFAGDDNTCPGQVDINAQGSWDALGLDGVTANRAAYAHALALELLAGASRLRGAWEDGFSDTVATAVEGNTTYPSAREGLNAVFDALFYLETSTKDRKLAKPLGLVDCDEVRCLEDIEGRAAGDSIARVEENLVGFRTLFTGAEGVGMDDLLTEVGHGDLSDQILADTDAAITLAEGLSGPMDALIVDSPADVEALHAAVRKVTDALKGELATVLELQIPTEAAGDND